MLTPRQLAVSLLLSFALTFSAISTEAHSSSNDFSTEFHSVKVLLATEEDAASDGKHNGDPFLGVKYHSGYIDIGEEGSEMWYWYFPCDNALSNSCTDDGPFAVWLTGGQGCSSELAALKENGPLTVLPDASVKHNPHSWTGVADVVYVDQPLGTGFSIAANPDDYVLTEKQIADHMHEFFTKFVDVYPNLKNRRFYITGESYAGHYIPAIAHSLLKRPIEGLRFEGIAIGNAWVDPLNQYPAYPEFAYETKMINEAEYKEAKESFEQCVTMIENELWQAPVFCDNVFANLLGKRNPFNIRLKCEAPPMCYNTKSLDAFMNKFEVQAALGVHKVWKECDPSVQILLLGDWSLNMSPKVAELLAAGKQVLIYSGELDFICNWRGGEAWVERIEWSKNDEFLATGYESWKVDGKLAGHLRKVDNLSFLRVMGAGHMVPMDQPAAALAMIAEFFQQTSVPPAASRTNRHSETLPFLGYAKKFFDLKAQSAYVVAEA